MKLFQRIFFAAVLAGLAAGLLMSGLQQWRVAPLLFAAEALENTMAETPAETPADAAAAPAADMPAMSGPEHAEGGWAPAEGMERLAYTVLANLLVSMGFALLLGAASILSGIEITAGNGIVWGLCGFLVFHLAPAFGLPPDLPGMPVADLAARQVWWWGTVLLTAAGVFGIAKFRNVPALAIGAALILLPHLAGAPPVPEVPSAVPAHLASAFAAATLGISAAFWLALGPLLGWLDTRFAHAENHIVPATGARA